MVFIVWVCVIIPVEITLFIRRIKVFLCLLNHPLVYFIMVSYYLNEQFVYDWISCWNSVLSQIFISTLCIHLHTFKHLIFLLFCAGTISSCTIWLFDAHCHRWFFIVLLIVLCFYFVRLRFGMLINSLIIYFLLERFYSFVLNSSNLVQYFKFIEFVYHCNFVYFY